MLPNTTSHITSHSPLLKIISNQKWHLALALAFIISANFISVNSAYSASSLEDAQVALLDDLRAAEQQLSETERRISNERTALANTLNEAEQKIERLQNETAASRRLADEATLSIQQLEERLESWEEQNIFQQNLLSRFNQQVSGESWSVDTLLTEKISWLGRFIAQRQSMLYPIWQEQEIVMPNGTLNMAEQLNIGPVSWFWEEQSQTGGFLDQEDGRTEVSLLFSENSYNNALGTLYSEQSGTLIFDPTLSRALRLEQEQESLLDHIGKGGLWAFPILLFAAFALTIALLKSIQLWRLPALIPALAERLQNGKQAVLLATVKGMQKELIAIMQETAPGQIRDDRLVGSLMNSKHRLEYWLGAIAITAAVSPLLGLLGTVSGMIEAFRLMTIFGTGDPAAVSSGISEALVTTELGLIVAIPSLVLHALLSRRVKSYYGQLESCAVTLSQVAVDDTDASVEGLPA